MDFFNLDYEKSLLSQMINCNEDGIIIADSVNSEYFYDKQNAMIFQEICDELKANKFCSLLSLVNALPSVSPTILSSIVGTTFTSANWSFYAGELKNLYIARQMKKIMGESLENLTPLNVSETVGYLDTFLTSCNDGNSLQATDVKSLTNELLEVIEKNSKISSMYLGLDSGWKNLSDILDGVQLDKLIVIGARPSIGKTSFSLQLASNLCENGASCAYFSLEMTRISLMMRLTSVKSGIPVSFIKHAISQNSSFYSKLNIALSKIYEYQLYIDDSRLRNEKELYSKIRYLAKTKGVKYFFVDHIGLVPYSMPNLKRVEQLDDITRNLLALAQELNVSIIVLCQLKRDAEGKAPTLSDLRDSGAIEQNADICMFLHRQRATGNEEEIPTEVIVIKNRDGACGTAEMSFLPKQTKFIEKKAS